MSKLPRRFWLLADERRRSRGYSFRDVAELARGILGTSGPSGGLVHDWFRRRREPSPQALQAVCQILEISLNSTVIIPTVAHQLSGTDEPSKVLETFDGIADRQVIRDPVADLIALFDSMTFRDYLVLLTVSTTPLEHRLNRWPGLADAASRALMRGVRLCYFFPTEGLSQHIRFQRHFREATSTAQFKDDLESFRRHAAKMMVSQFRYSEELADRRVNRYLGCYEFGDTQDIIRASETIGIFGTASYNAARNLRIAVRMPDEPKGFVMCYPRDTLFQARLLQLWQCAIVPNVERLRQQVEELRTRRDSDYQPPNLDALEPQLKLACDFRNAAFSNEQFLDDLDSEDYRL